MKQVFILALVLWACQSFAQLNGRIASSDSGVPLSGATVQLLGAGYTAQSDERGMFSLPASTGNDTLYVRYVGYLARYIPVGVSTESPMDITLEPDENMLEEVEVNTGFYQVPRERATGSFTHVDNKTLNRAVGGSILQRLEGIASGVQFTQANGTSAASIRVRGLATIESNEEPLIVVDNFPYEGNINTINPNDVESITVLKDAAAASIWGARAGNGVIVITTKQGRYNQKTHISLNSNVTVGAKPDLFYSQSRLPSDIVMQIEQDKYQRGGYYLESTNQRPFPEYVELLIARDSGWISEADFLSKESILRNAEVRDEALKYLYQPPVYQQYALNVRGGGDTYAYYFSAEYDKNRSDVVGNDNNRLNLNLQNTFRPVKGMELTAGMWYTQQQGKNNGLSLNDLRAGGTQTGISPYIRLKNEAGNNLSIVKDYRLHYVDGVMEDGLLDWQYRPLDEVALADNRSRSNEMRLNGGLRYNFLRHFNVNANYQYVRSRNENNSLYDENSYYVRDMINRFTQEDGSLIIPHAAIFNAGSPSESFSHSGRVQINYQQHFHENHGISALAGGEIRDYTQHSFPGYRLYNYNSDLLTGTTFYDYTETYPLRPAGNNNRIESPSNYRRRLIDRYLSYFGNVSYTYRNRYILSGSARWDGSNLFGVKANQKGTPLWSVGASWEANKEDFYMWDWLPYLRIRTSYGSSGNVNKNVSVYPTAGYSINSRTGLLAGRITSAGNPSLRWEQVNTFNLALDVAIKNRRISGSLEYYSKKATDLIGADRLPPNTGVISGGTASATNLINYANLHTRGVDVQLASQNLQGTLQWQSVLLFNYVRNKITHFNTREVTTISNYFSSTAVPSVVGRSRDVVYAFPWHGLDPTNGMPIVYIDDQLSDDYVAYIDDYIPEDLLVAGVNVPPFYGSLRNDLRWRGVSLSVLVSWKGGYVFRRNSIASGAEFSDPNAYHMDYLRRWRQPGDEVHTDVPGYADTEMWQRSSAYQNSKALISRGDHIRLQDISLSYTLSQRHLSGMPMQRIKLYAYARNLGVLWRDNKHKIDPDYVAADWPAPRTFAVGVQVDF